MITWQPKARFFQWCNCLCKAQIRLLVANSTKYGLGCTIFTKDIERALTAADKIKSGTVCINNPLMENIAAPFFRLCTMGLALTLAMTTGCGDSDEAGNDCEVDAYQCGDEEMLQQCDPDAGWVDVEDCAAQGLMCHAEMGHCMAD